MTDGPPTETASGSDAAACSASPRPLTPAAERALAEAAARRAASQAVEAVAVKEINGRKGPEPVRYGDWEVKGLASDF